MLRKEVFNMEKVAIYVRESNHPNAQDTIRKQERKVTDYCTTKGYSVCDTASIIGDRKEGFPVLMKLLQNAKSKGIDNGHIAAPQVGRSCHRPKLGA